MDKEKYLNSIVDKYKPKQQPESTSAFKDVCSLIKSWAGETLQSLHLVGAHRKETATTISNDVDLLIIMDSKTCFDLKHLYENLSNFLTVEGYSPFEKTISLGIIHSKISFDLIPAMKSSINSANIRVHNRRQNSCIETNILQHTETIKASGLIKLIILTKIWRDLNKLYFPSFYLELCVLDLLHHQKKNSLEKNFLFIMDFLSNDFIETKIIDPANSDNIISDILSYEEKMEITRCANNTRKKASWEEIVW